MKKLPKILLYLIIFLMLNGCATLYVNSTAGKGVQPDVKKEMVLNEKRIREERRAIDKGHKQQRKAIEKAQNKSWK